MNLGLGRSKGVSGLSYFEGLVFGFTGFGGWEALGLKGLERFHSRALLKFIV